MKKVITLSVLVATTCIFLMSFRPKRIELSECFTIIKEEWGKNCGSSNSYSVKWRNDCNENLDFKYALQRTNGTWDAGQSSNTPPGGVILGAWTCKATGKYKYWVRRPSESGTVRFPTQSEIDAE